MKLRLQGSSIRLRLTRGEVALLMQIGSIQARLEFPNGTELLYGLEMRGDLDTLTAQFARSIITVSVPEAEARTWAGSDQVGMSAQAGKLALLVEKDFQCLHGERDPDAFEGHPDCPQ